MRIEPYLQLNGQAEAAMAFYQSALGATVEMLMRFSDSPEPIPEDQIPAEHLNRVMHASLLIDGARLMLTDGGCMTGRAMGGFSLSLQYAGETEARRAFNALAEEGTIDMPIGPTFWSPCFGMVTDKFGVQWMVTVE